jgi:hypothetical protein
MKLLLTTVFVAILGSILGYWTNQVATWKIKYKIDALDSLYESICQVDALLLRLKKTYSLLGTSYYGDGPNANKFIFDVHQIKNELDIITSSMYLHDAIVDKKFYNEINMYKNLLDIITSNVEQMEGCTNFEKYEIAQTSFLDKILIYKKQLISIFGMLKQLVDFK